MWCYQACWQLLMQPLAAPVSPPCSLGARDTGDELCHLSAELRKFPEKGSVVGDLTSQHHLTWSRLTGTPGNIWSVCLYSGRLDIAPCFNLPPIFQPLTSSLAPLGFGMCVGRAFQEAAVGFWTPGLLASMCHPLGASTGIPAKPWNPPSHVSVMIKRFICHVLSALGYTSCLPNWDWGM